VVDGNVDKSIGGVVVVSLVTGMIGVDMFTVVVKVTVVVVVVVVIIVVVVDVV